MYKGASNLTTLINIATLTIAMAIQLRVETGSGHPGYVLSKSTGSDSDSALDHVL